MYVQRATAVTKTLTFQSMVVTSRLTSVRAGKCFNTIGSGSASSPLLGICHMRAVASPDLLKLTMIKQSY